MSDFLEWTEVWDLLVILALMRGEPPDILAAGVFDERPSSIASVCKQKDCAGKFMS